MLSIIRQPLFLIEFIPLSSHTIYCHILVAGQNNRTQQYYTPQTAHCAPHVTGTI
jgi:hypothetical protein